MATKLKKVKLTSVDFVNAGANQDADIKFFKSADGGQNMKEEEMRKSFFDTVKDFFIKNSGEDDIASLEKSRIAKAKETIESENDLYTSVLKKSLDSIIFNDDLDSGEKLELMNKSLVEFNETMADAVNNWSQLDKSITEDTIKKAYESQSGGGAEMAYRVNKNLLNPEEQKQLETLLEKSKCKKADDMVDDDMADDDEVIVTEEETEKLAGCGGDKVNKAFAGEVAELRKTVAELRKASEMKEMREIASKYAPLGRKEDELAEKLYNMKKSSKDAYDEYVALLDESMGFIEKSGIFGEIGKSGANYGFGGGSVTNKIESIASDIQKSDASLSRVEAVAKAWEQHPELVAQYEKEYRG
jgi:hypothetical protein